MGEINTFRASDGYPFYYHYYPSAGTPRGRLVFVHGIRSHAGWYSRSCAWFARYGLEVYFLDRRGAGLNTAQRGDAPSFRRLLDDVAEFLQHLRGEQNWLPLFLAGISWGGKLAVGLSYRKAGLVDGLILLCPGLVAKVQPSFIQRGRIALARVAQPARCFPIPLNEPDLFTASVEWQKYIAGDPHGLREATARFLFSSFSFDLYLRRAHRHVASPVFLALAEHDRIIDNAATCAIARKWRGDTRIVEYPRAYHTLEFEGEQHPWKADVASWIEDQLREKPRDLSASSLPG